MRTPWRNRAGMALPLAVIFCGLMTVTVYYMTRTRVEQKRQNLSQFNALQAHFLAQGALQLAMLKVRVLPNEAYAATALARGLCPFHVTLGGGAAPATGAGATQDALNMFIEDLNTDALPLAFGDRDEFRVWHSEIAKARALTSFTVGVQTVNVVSMEAHGVVPMWVKDPLTNEWKTEWFEDKVTKTVEVRRGS